MSEAGKTNGSWTGMGYLHSKHHCLCVCYIPLFWIHAQGEAWWFLGQKSTFYKWSLDTRGVLVVSFAKQLFVCFFLKQANKAAFETYRLSNIMLNSFMVALYKAAPSTHFHLVFPTGWQLSFSTHFHLSLHFMSSLSCSASLCFSLFCLFCWLFVSSIFNFIYKVTKKRHNSNFGNFPPEFHFHNSRWTQYVGSSCWQMHDPSEQSKPV